MGKATIGTRRIVLSMLMIAGLVAALVAPVGAQSKDRFVNRFKVRGGAVDFEVRVKP